MANVPEDLKYTREHEWAKQESDRVRVGTPGVEFTLISAAAFAREVSVT